ncbi:MAG: UDP-N-acetylglucosamine 2-epimerase (non-hydrolyzing) [Candidatus Peribacteraceae bacterium]|nr:UDP-N-acetylglucosamine 2-epimerase (non-hydrolyzing) [Candidatus Peribacteraceae bacterium]
MKTIISITSARPNFVKLAAVHHAFAQSGRSDIRHVIIHTGQHYDPLFSDIFFSQLGIPMPDENLGIHGGTREEVIAKTADALGPVFEKYQPHTVLVYGDVNGAVGGAIAAKRADIRLAHVEAGLRSFDLSMPEEHNRREIDSVADILLCSEQSAVKNLQQEAKSGTIEFVGNTMIDTLIRMLPLIRTEPLPVQVEGSYVVATLHRPSNVDDPVQLQNNLTFLSDIAQFHPVILPLHHRTKAALENFGLMPDIPPHVLLIESLGYIPFLRLVRDSAFIITDSGGIQEEAVLLGKKCFTLRKNTERPATIESGSNVLIDLEDDSDWKLVLNYTVTPIAPVITVPPLWDGKAGERIVKLLAA